MEMFIRRTVEVRQQEWGAVDLWHFGIRIHTVSQRRFGRIWLYEVKKENQRDSTNSIFIIKLLPQHVSGIIIPIIRRIRPCPTACGVLPGGVGCGWLWSCGAAS